MLWLREKRRISCDMDVTLSFRTQVVCISSTSFLSLPPCCFVLGIQWHKSRSFCQLSIPKSSLVFLQWSFFVGGTQSSTPASHYCSLVLSLYFIAIRTRCLLGELIPGILTKSLQESSVLGCSWLDIHCSLVWCIQLLGGLSFQNSGCIFCNYHRLSAFLLFSMILSQPFTPMLW